MSVAINDVFFLNNHYEHIAIVLMRQSSTKGFPEVYQFIVALLNA